LNLPHFFVNKMTKRLPFVFKIAKTRVGVNSRFYSHIYTAIFLA